MCETEFEEDDLPYQYVVPFAFYSYFEDLGDETMEHFKRDDMTICSLQMLTFF
jgi:hypothetical protein